MTIRFKIEGLDCPNCAQKLAARFEKLDGIASAKINFLAEKLTLESDLDAEKLIPLLQSEADGFEDGITIRK